MEIMFTHTGLEGRQIKTHLLPVVLHGITKCGAWSSVVVKALRYKSEGPGIDSWNFSRGI